MILLLTGCFLLDRPYKRDLGTTPEDLGDGWPIAAPEDVGLDPAILADIHEELLREDQFFGTLGLLVVKDGYLVFEAYYRDPDDRDHVHHLQSATKSVTSTIAGIGWDAGWIPDLSLPLCDAVGEACGGLSEKKRSITLDDLLTMRSGLDLDNERMAYELLVNQPEDPLRYLLELPLYADPGEEFYYRDVDPQLMSYAIQALAGQTEEEIAAEQLFAPLGIEDWYWEDLHEGTTTGAFGLHLRPRDLAKFGQMALDGGAWQGQRVVSAEWLDLATAEVTADAWQGFGYGHYWWSSAEDGAFYAAGHGGQFAVAVPARGLLLVQIALPDAELHGSAPADFFEVIRPLWE